VTHIQVVRIKKLTGKNIVDLAARHNHREIVTERGADGHIDVGRTPLNRVMRGEHTAAGVANTAQALLDDAGIKSLRKDSVRALEIIFCLPPKSAIDHESFFRDSLMWADQYFQAPVISAIIHCDEAAPHCHVLVLPLVRGRMIGSDLMGNRAKLQAMQSDFHAKVGQRYGLTRQAAQKRLNASVRRSAINAAFDVLEANSGLNREVLKVLLEPHLQDPEPLLLALGLEMPKQKEKRTFVGIMTKPTTPERREKSIGFENTKPIGLDDSSTPETEQTLSCVGFGKSPPPNLQTATPANAPLDASVTISDTAVPLVEPRTDDAPGDWTRERESEIPADRWHDGEPRKIPVKASTKRQVVEAVNAVLEARKASKAEPLGTMRR